jgi:hypothetical protein
MAGQMCRTFGTSFSAFTVTHRSSFTSLRVSALGYVLSFLTGLAEARLATMKDQ